MNYKIERLVDLPVIVVTWDKEFSFEDDYKPYHDALIEALDAEEKPVYLIIDLHEVKMTFNDIMTGIRMSIKGGNSALGHPNLLKTAVVTLNRAMQMSVKGLNTVSFGNLDLPVFDSLEKALSYVRDKAS